MIQWGLKSGILEAVSIMNKKRIRLSPVEFALILFLAISLLLNVIEARRQETLRAQRVQARGE